MPNVTGNISSSWGSFIWLKDSGVGALRHKSDLQSTYVNTYNNNVSAASTAAADLGFDAALSNPIYGKSTTVQPPAIAVKMLIKY